MDNKIEEPIFTFEGAVIQQVQDAHSGRCNQDLTESIEPFNELATYYAQMAIKDLDLNQQHHPLLNAYILSGKKTGLDIFVGDEKIEQVFHSICQYLQLQYEQTKDNSFENYRLRIFWLSDSDCSDVLPILDLLLNLSQQTGLLIDVHYADSNPIQLANAQHTFNTHINNQTKILSIIYDETIDLYDIHISHYFDLIVGFIDQCWSSSSDDDNNNRVLNNIQQWTKLSKQIQGFNFIESTLN
ncbi:unnamed protein product [Adineta steineri]|uniref:Uncharacterized protein n=1 Tax=Adineta steineri TaxID=433720 RepID=A0A814PBT5_9BILA|nr:unnamed protein product [Adineta steineri]